MKKKIILLDTNVLYAGLYSSRGASFKILQAIDKGTIKIVLSTTLLFEYEDILKRKQSELKLTTSEINKILDNLCALAKHQRIYFLWRPYLPDPKDDHILEVAVASKINLILTHNLKDFKRIDKFGIQAITPRKLLEEIK